MFSLRDIYTHLLLTLTVLAMSSCGQSDDPVPTPSEANYSFGFYITVGEVSSKSDSRAPSDGEYDPGEGYENFIDLGRDDIRVVLYNRDNTLISEVSQFVVLPVGSYESSKRYYLQGNTKSDLSSGKFKIAVIANWKTYPTDLSLTEVWSKTYQFDSPELSETNTIPLFGIKECSLTGVKVDSEIKIGTIHLLRAFAKIEVILKNGSSADEAGGNVLPENDYWHFRYLRLSHYNDSGFNAPTGVDSQDDYVKDSWKNDYVPYVSIPTTAQVRTNLDFVPTAKNHWVVYVPEYNNQGANPASIDLDYVESSQGPKSIRIIDPDDASKFADFKRNVWYRVTIYKNKEKDEFVADVIPYKVIDLDPIFGLDTKDNTESETTK